MSVAPAGPRAVVPLDPSQAAVEADLVAKIGDAIRGSLLTNQLERIPSLVQAVIQQVTKRGGRYYIKNFWADPSRLSKGYVGVHVKIRMPLPRGRFILMEIQVHAKQIMNGTAGCAKEIAHRLYKMPGETAEEKDSPDVISSSQLIYLTSMVKLLCTREEVRRVEKLVDAMQAATKADKTMRLVLETAQLLNKEKELGSGEWSEELKAIVPENRDAVAAAWMETATKINGMLKLPIVPRDESYSWTNTARSIDELYADAEQIASEFETMCEEAAGQPGCSVNFGPEDKYMIKERKSLQDKIEKDKRALSVPPPPEAKPAGQVASVPSPKEAYVKLLVQLLENASVKSHPSLAEILRSQVTEVMNQESQELTPKQTKSYQWAQALLVDQKVAQIVSENLHKLHASEEKTSPAVEPQRLATPVPSIAFGAAEWRKYFGDVGIEPPLPPNIEQILSRPCPFTPLPSRWNPFGSAKTIRETHLLVLVPQTVNGQPLTLKSLGELVKWPLQGPASKYKRFDLGAYADPPASRSHWALITRTVVEGSRNKSYKDQQAVLADYSRQASMPYFAPKVLDTTVAIFMEHVRTGTELYGENPWTYTRCQEKYEANWQLIVGGFSASGLRVHFVNIDCEYDGVGGSLEVPGLGT
jgi:hypothetical protein